MSLSESKQIAMLEPGLYYLVYAEAKSIYFTSYGVGELVLEAVQIP